MKICPLNLQLHTKSLNAFSVSSIPLRRNVKGIEQCDTVSFKSANVDKEDAYNLRNIPNLTCACCGKKMINENDYKKLRKKDFEGPASPVLKKLQPYSKLMRPTEKTVFNMLKRASVKDPNADLNTLLKKRYYYHLGRLEVKQLNIINQAAGMDLNLNDETKEKLNKTLASVRYIMFVEPKEDRNKRSRIINEFKKLKDKCSEKQKIDKMLELLQNLPSSKNDVDAFMTKYIQRGNREIGQRLLSTALPTLDHIKPSKKSGHDDFSNMLVLCEKCNSERGHIPYDEWFITHPSMPKNIVKNLNKIDTEIREGRLKNFDGYTESVTATLKKYLNDTNFAKLQQSS